jgi:hypothetical protein
MGYYIDLSEISLDAYKAKLESNEMIPSRRILKEKTEERFSFFKSIGVQYVAELLTLLKKKNKITELSKEKCFTEEYLKILLRELNSILPKPTKIKDFLDISPETVLKLQKLGIKNTIDLFNIVKTPEQRKELAKKAGVTDSEILEFAKLADLSRIKWVGPTFARLLYNIGTDTLEKATKADYTDLHKKIVQINKEKNYFKGQIGLNDIRLFVEAAKEVPVEIEYE